jgi:hypothetical protein
VLDGVSLKVEADEVVAMLGPWAAESRRSYTWSERSTGRMPGGPAGSTGRPADRRGRLLRPTLFRKARVAISAQAKRATGLGRMLLAERKQGSDSRLA